MLDRAVRRLQDYFAGQLTEFDLPPDFGTGFQEQVRRAKAAIPFGQTRTRGEPAKEIGVTAQAIGQARGAKPLPVLIPCHRVAGATTSGGFSATGGVETKVFLLTPEGAASLLI